jgi:hypothetical protein
MQHLINKQTIHLSMNKNTNAFQMQQQMSRHFWNKILPQISTVFDELSNDEDVVRISKLEINLGELTEKEMFQANWEDVILSAIRSHLYKKITEKHANVIRIREAKTISICRQWFFYLIHGYLPWNTLDIDASWYKSVLEALATDISSINELRKLIKDDQRISLRIAYQHSTDFVISLIEILTAQNQNDLLLLAELVEKNCELSNTTSSTNKIKDVKTTIWMLLVGEAASSNSHLNSEELFEKILLLDVFRKTVLDWQDSATVQFDKVAAIIKKVKKKVAVAAPISANIDNLDVEGSQKKNSENKQTESIDEEGIFVRHAGVVLVHPFLPALFSRLGLTKDGKFINNETQQKGMHLIHYLATGLSNAEEYELPVAKILCAWPMEMPVRKESECSSEELQEASAMLQAAIDQWVILKNTSVEGLQSGFLQRSGKLFTKDDKLYLRVETQSIDVLLDQLPWVLSMIKLPWMKTLLRVEWR